MADEAYQDRTEQPTPKRRLEAREKGQEARSRDLSAALVFLTGLGVLAAWNSSLGSQSAAFMRSWLGELRPGLVTQSHVPVLFLQCGWALGKLLAPVWLSLVVAAILANYLQSGWLFAPGRLTPDLSRLQLLGGLKRLFSGASLVELAKSLAKVGCIGLVVYYFFCSHLVSLLPLVRQDPGQVLLHLQSGSFQIFGRVVLLLLILGLLDYLYQRYRFEKSLRMTKQEVKDEMRQRRRGTLG